MDATAIDEMAALEDHHWWFVGKRLIVRALLEPALAGPAPRVLDVGCGTSGVLGALAADARTVGVDRSHRALAHARRHGLSALAVAGGSGLPFAPDAFDVVLLLDVLEHFADEDALLSDVRRVLAPGGRLLVSVPAFQFLWSAHDEALEHKRRYTGARLRRALERSGFRVDRVTYTNLIAFPPAVLVRGLAPRLGLGRRDGTDFARHPEVVNRALVACYRAEARWLRRLGLPVGLSVAALARRPVALAGAPV